MFPLPFLAECGYTYLVQHNNKRVCPNNSKITSDEVASIKVDKSTVSISSVLVFYVKTIINFSTQATGCTMYQHSIITKLVRWCVGGCG